MIRAGWQITVARAAGEVFDFVADLRNEPRFNPDASNVARETPGPVGLGTVFTEHLRGGGRFRTTVGRYEPPSRLEFDAHNPRTDARVQFEFGARGAHETDVSCTVEIEMKGAMRVAEPLMAPMIRRRIERTRGPMLKRALESQVDARTL